MTNEEIMCDYNSETSRKVIEKRIQSVIATIPKEVNPIDVINAMLSEAGCYIACNTNNVQTTNDAVKGLLGCYIEIWRKKLKDGRL